MPALFTGSVILGFLGGLCAQAGDPARYPVTRYEAPGDKPASTPSAVVLDDCDETFEAGWPHHDGLRILRASDTQK